MPSPTLLMTAYRTWCSGPSSSYPIISEAGGWRLWLYQVRATSHARLAMATQCWETHRGRPLSLEAELLVFFFQVCRELCPLNGAGKAASLCIWKGRGKLRTGKAETGAAHAPSCWPGKDLLPWLRLGHGLLREAIHPTRLSELP